MQKRKKSTGKIRPRSISTTKGTAFELQVQRVLENAKALSDGQLTYKVKPQLKLQNGEIVFPDFRVRIEERHKVQYILVECQNRKLTGKAILHKIQHIRGKSRYKTFIFVHANGLGSELERTFENEGVCAHDMEGFRHFINNEAASIRPAQSYTYTVGSRVASLAADKLAQIKKPQSAFYGHPLGEAAIQEFLNQGGNNAASNPAGQS